MKQLSFLVNSNKKTLLLEKLFRSANHLPRTTYTTGDRWPNARGRQKRTSEIQQVLSISCAVHASAPSFGHANCEFTFLTYIIPFFNIEWINHLVPHDRTKYLLHKLSGSCFSIYEICSSASLFSTISAIPAVSITGLCAIML